MWTLSAPWKKQAVAEAKPDPKVCRVCWGVDDEDGEEKWVAPCRCPRTIAWVHQNCLAWRLKWTPTEEDKLRCAVCKFPYMKGLRLKSLREWFNGWSEDWDTLQLDMNFLWLAFIWLQVIRKAPLHGAYRVLLILLLAVLVALLRIYLAYRRPERYGLAFYKRFLAVAVRDWVLDAPPPPLSTSSATS